MLDPALCVVLVFLSLFQLALVVGVYLLEHVDVARLAQQTGLGQDLVHELLVGHEAIQVPVESCVQVVHLRLSGVEPISLHHPLEVFLGQFALFVGIHASKSVVNVEGGLSGQSFLEDLNVLIDLKVTNEDVEESLSGGFGEELGPRNAFEVDVLVLALGQRVRVVAVLWREGLAEV